MLGKVPSAGTKKRQVRQGPAFKGSYTRKSAHVVGCISSIIQRRTGTRGAEIHVPQLFLRYTEELTALRRWNMRQRHGGERQYEALGGVGCAWGDWEGPRLERQAEVMCFPKWVRAAFHQSHLLNCSFGRWRSGMCILTSSPLIFEKHWYIASLFCFIELEIKLERDREYTKLLEIGRIFYTVLGTLDLGPMGGVPSGRIDIRQLGGNTPGMGCRRR